MDTAKTEIRRPILEDLGAKAEELLKLSGEITQELARFDRMVRETHPEEVVDKDTRHYPDTPLGRIERNLENTLIELRGNRPWLTCLLNELNGPAPEKIKPNP